LETGNWKPKLVAGNQLFKSTNQVKNRPTKSHTSQLASSPTQTKPTKLIAIVYQKSNNPTNQIFNTNNNNKLSGSPNVQLANQLAS